MTILGITDRQIEMAIQLRDLKEAVKQQEDKAKAERQEVTND
jgi:hypothetical protein